MGIPLGEEGGGGLESMKQDVFDGVAQLFHGGITLGGQLVSIDEANLALVGGGEDSDQGRSGCVTCLTRWLT